MIKRALVLSLLLASPAQAQLSESQLLTTNELTPVASEVAANSPNGAQYLYGIQQDLTEAVVAKLGKTKIKPGSTATAQLKVDAAGKLAESRIVASSGSPEVKKAMESVIKRIVSLNPPPPELMQNRQVLSIDITYEAPK